VDEGMIGARLRILRRWRGMTQAELAGLASLSPSFVSMIESGQRPLDRRSHIAAVATAQPDSRVDRWMPRGRQLATRFPRISQPPP
jgi:transcriptional regulator with XRE-family HTH domain